MVHNKQLSTVCQELQFDKYIITNDTVRPDLQIVRNLVLALQMTYKQKVQQPYIFSSEEKFCCSIILFIIYLSLHYLLYYLLLCYLM